MLMELLRKFVKKTHIRLLQKRKNTVNSSKILYLTALTIKKRDALRYG